VGGAQFVPPAERISRIQYSAGASDLLSGLQLRNAQLANRSYLRLALGGSYDSGLEDLGDGDGKAR
jgi:hypothetical protein